MRRKKRQQAKWLTAALALLSLIGLSIFGWTNWTKQVQVDADETTVATSSAIKSSAQSSSYQSSSKSSKETSKKSASSSTSSKSSDDLTTSSSDQEVQTETASLVQAGTAASATEQVQEVSTPVLDQVATSAESTYVEPAYVAPAETTYVAQAPVYTESASAGTYPVLLANGNSAGAVGTAAAAQIAAITGTDAATWEYIIARESNGNPSAYNPSGASGLFQTMPGWGSTATVQDQINAAVNAYNNQGFAAWGVQ